MAFEISPNSTYGPDEVAQLLFVTVSTLASWRHLGDGPPFVKTNRARNGRVFYLGTDLISWMEARRVVRPSDDGETARSPTPER